MRILLFYPSLLSDWNNGIAHFLRGFATELILAGHEIQIFEPARSKSFNELIRHFGSGPLSGFKKAYPLLSSHRYDPETLDLDEALERADAVIVHEGSPEDVIRRLARHRESSSHYRLLFHYTHSAPLADARAIEQSGVGEADGALVSGSVLRSLFLKNGWVRQAWIWPEAADVRVFYPRTGQPEGDVVCVGNWGENAHGPQLEEFFAKPVRELGVSARVHGVRFPADTLELFRRSGIDYAGWLPNTQVPELYSCYKLAVHIPHRPLGSSIPGLAPIRLFEALACGIPVVSAPWDDADGLFRAGKDYVTVSDRNAMKRALRDLLNDPAARAEVAGAGRERVLARHTCAHRVRELMAVFRDLGLSTQPRPDILHSPLRRESELRLPRSRDARFFETAGA